MKLFSESLGITNLISVFTTAAASALHKVKVEAGEKCALLCQYGGSTGSTDSFVSAAVVNSATFTLLESTGASLAGSAVSGATLSLGAATARKVRNCNIGIIQVTTDLTTATGLDICGVNIHTSVTGPGRDGEQVSAELASIINANTTLNRKVEAYANLQTTGIVTLLPKSGCTGISLISCGASYVVGFRKAIGMIEFEANQLSTNSPKYVGVALTTVNGNAAARSVDLIKFPSYAPSFAGKVVKL